MEAKRKNILIIHPGTQYAYRLANALSINVKNKVSLYTWFTLSIYHPLAKFDIFKKRVKQISSTVKVYNFPVFEFFSILHNKLNKILRIKGNNGYYYWQVLFSWFLLPKIYLYRKNSIIITVETCGWPLVKYAKKWGITVVMDFPSISHEKAETLGITETRFGKTIKTKERQHIDFAINCSKFAKDSYTGLTSAKKHFPVWLGTDFTLNDTILPQKINKNQLHICCLANTELRKGIDILIEAFNKIEIENKKLYLIGHIHPKWVSDFCSKNNLSRENIILTGPKPQKDLKELLIKEQIDLHILPSRFDSFGMVVPETMALGIVNILSPFVGAGEMLDHKKDGFIMNDLDSNNLAFYIAKYFHMSTDEKYNLSSSALHKSKQMTWDNYTQRTFKIFKEIITAS